MTGVGLGNDVEGGKAGVSSCIAEVDVVAVENRGEVDLLDTNGNCIIEGAGVAGTLMAAMGEAGKAITLHLADEWLMARVTL